jgi:hypothetical protein
VDASIERHAIGVLLTSTRSYMECSQSTIKRSRRAGIHVLGGARAQLHSCTVTGSGENGCLAQHAHSTVLATDTSFSGNGSSGVQVSVGASMHLQECELCENRIAGAQSTVRSRALCISPMRHASCRRIGLWLNRVLCAGRGHGHGASRLQPGNKRDDRAVCEQGVDCYGRQLQAAAEWKLGLRGSRQMHTASGLSV